MVLLKNLKELIYLKNNNMNDELKQILTGAIIFSLILFGVMVSTKNNNLSSNIEDRNAQYNY